MLLDDLTSSEERAYPVRIPASGTQSNRWTGDRLRVISSADVIVVFQEPSSSADNVKLEFVGSRSARERFEELAPAWERDTRHHSSFSRIRQHPAYGEIRRMGEKAIPWILARMDESSAYWFLMLADLVPDPPEIKERGNIDSIKMAWKSWAVAHGFGGHAC